MDTVKNIWTLKEELKQSAKDLHDTKKEIKKIQKEQGSGNAGILQYSVIGARREHRHKHIAYSMMRGRTYEQIEPKCAEGNQPDHDLIQRIINDYAQEAVRACA